MRAPTANDDRLLLEEGGGTASRRRLGAFLAFPGFILGTFQLVGRSHVGQFLGDVESVWYLEVRLWLLVALSLWLLGLSVADTLAARHRLVGQVRSVAALVALFVGYMVVTALWAPNALSANIKAYNLVYIAWSCGLMATAVRLCGVRGTVEGFWSAIFLFGIMFAVIGTSVAAPATWGGGRLSVLGGGPNVFGRNMGLLFLGALRLSVRGDSRWMRGSAALVIPVAALLVFLSGSRGAMLALFVAVVVYAIVLRFERRVGNSLLFGGVIGLVMALSSFGRRAIAAFSDRFVRRLLVEGYTSNRAALFSTGVAAGLENPIGGLGLGGFAQVSTLGTYPHNIFIEAFAEGGMIGLALLCLPLISFVSKWGRGQRIGDATTVAGLFLVGVSSSISGDLFDARGMFLFLLMAVATQWSLRNVPVEDVRRSGRTSAL